MHRSTEYTFSVKPMGIRTSFVNLTTNAEDLFSALRFVGSLGETFKQRFSGSSRFPGYAPSGEADKT
jgi:hypothetical protein